jgi:hypothetical protein
VPQQYDHHVDDSQRLIRGGIEKIYRMRTDMLPKSRDRVERTKALLARYPAVSWPTVPPA